MFTLKNYQKETLAVLRRYLEAARLDGPQAAFEVVTAANPAARQRAYWAIPELEDTPYVCLRLPTGGGKTLLAAHSAAIAAQAFLERDYPLVLWLVPTNTIRAQTLETLKKPGHPNRLALEDAFGGRLLVVDITDFVLIRPQDLRSKAVIVVGTLQTLRVNSTEGRKVYAHHEALEPHFASLAENTPGMERIENGPGKGQIRYSFRNLLALWRPLVVIDEAHNATSDLSFEVLQRIRPACILEYTATPANNSNILHNVSAAELKAEEMIKLPIVLTEHSTWQEAVSDSLRTCQKLHDLAVHDPDFIHPIVLIQAEEKGRDVTYEIIRQYLIDGERIAPERIAVATGTQRELDGVNLLDLNNKVEFVITVEALKEGWDCPFAYVFCSVATVHSKKDVEQILGRVLRMPYARRRSQDELNRAYAHVSSTSWPQAVSQLQDRLVSMGFEEQEAAGAIQPLPRPLPGFEQTRVEALRLTLSGEPALLYLSAEERDRVTVLKLSEERGEYELVVNGELTPDLERKLVEAAPSKDREALKKTLAVYRRQRPVAPAQQGVPFRVPQLCLWAESELELVEREWYLDPGGWNLLDFPAKLEPAEFSIEERAESFLIDLNGKHLVTRYLGTQLPLDIHDVDTGWTELLLNRWLDGKLYQPDIRQEALLEFLRRTVTHLIRQRGYALETLARGRFLLEKALRRKIMDYRQQACERGYQRTLFGGQVIVATSYTYAFNFSPNQYPAHWLYSGGYQFGKHYYPTIGELESKGEEFECAQAIDRSSLVRHWVRNIANQPVFSFRLPLSEGYFYPDFVAELKDERILVVEYKGAHLLEGAQEKLNIGQLWQEKSNGQGLFLMAVKEDEWGRYVYRQIEEKVSSV